MTQLPPQIPTGAVPNPGKGLSIAGMVLSIVSLAILVTIGNVLWFTCAIVGLILSIMGKKRSKVAGQPTGMATAGIVLSLISLIVMPLLAVIIWFWIDISNWFGEAWTTIRN